MLRRLPFLIGLLTLAAPLRAETVPLSGPLDEQLGVALALAERCQTMRPYEFQFLYDTWRKAYPGSADAKRIEAAASAANKGPLGFTEAGRVTIAAERELAARYRARAAEIACPEALDYESLGKLEAYKRSGTHVLLAANLRGQAETAPGMTPLSAEERQIVQLFGAELARLMGEQMPQFEQLLSQLGEAHVMSYADMNQSVAAAYLEGEQRIVLRTIHFDAIMATAGFSGRGRMIDRGKGFAEPGSLWTRDGAPAFTALAAPRTLSLAAPGNAGLPLSVNAALMLDTQGRIVIGLFGQKIAEYTGDLSAGAKNEDQAAMAGAAYPDCPMARCFAFSPEEIGKLPSPYDDGDGKVWFFVSRSASATKASDDANSIKLGGSELRAMVTSAGQP
jgi:hypothetical protein